MIQQRPFLLLASASVLTLALAQASAEEAAPAAAPEAAPAAPAEAAPAPNEPAAAADAMRAEMEKRYAEMKKRYQEMMVERKARYEELRKQAAEAGMEMPEMPPWERGGPMYGPGRMPPMGPGMMGPGMAGGEPGSDEAAAGEAPKPPMTPEEAMAMREKRWEEMRARAAEQGVELPETPPWEAAEQRRKEMLERYNQYRSTIEAMSDEQKEAISALFGNGMPGSGCRQPMGRGGYPGYRYGMGPGGWGQMPEMPPAPDMPEMPQPPAAPAPSGE